MPRLPTLSGWLQSLMRRRSSRGVGRDLVDHVRSSEQMRSVERSVPTSGRPLRGNRVEILDTGPVTMVDRNGRVTLSPFAKGIFRVYIQGKREHLAWARDNSWTVDLSTADNKGWRFTGTRAAPRYSCSLGDGSQASVDADPADGTVSFRVLDDYVLNDATAPQVTGDWILLKKRLDTQGTVSIFGFGENALPMDKAGDKVFMWNTAPFIRGPGGGGLSQSWPVAIFLREDGVAMGLVVDTPSYSTFSFSKDGKRADCAAKNTELNYFVLLGPHLPDIARQLARLTGTISPIPKWAMGYHQSRWSYTPSDRVREVAAEFRERDIPCDAIYLDIDYMDRFKCFTWDRGFHDHVKLIADLHAKGYKVVTILDPGLRAEAGYGPYEDGVGRKAFVADRKGRPVTGKVWAGTSYFPDFASQPVRQWWGHLVNEFAADGIDGIWCDMNEPTTFDSPFSLPPRSVHRPSPTATASHERIHNVYGYLMSRATHEGLSEGGKIPFVMTRATYLGGQKYAITWTGDNHSSWDDLHACIPMILGLGLSGQPISGPDIGGYAGTPSPKLYERWILQGALYPYSRTHTRKDTPDQEPWSFGPEVEESARRAIRLRYRLIPYLYSLTYDSSRTGEPLARPIFWSSAEGSALDPAFYETQFMLGPNLLAAPLMDESPTRKCYLPSGSWYSWWSRDKIEGGRVYETSSENDTDLPLFVADNAVIPLYPEGVSFVPDGSLPSLDILVTLSSRAEGRVVEYYDNDSLLAFEVLFIDEGEEIRGEIRLLRSGSPPSRYRPPQLLRMLLSRRILTAEVITPCSRCSHESIDEVWTAVTIADPAFPLRCALPLPRSAQ